MPQRIFIIGATGKVGSGLVKQILEKDIHGHANPTSIVGVASSKGYLYDSKGLPEAQIKDFSSKRIPGNKYSKLTELIDLLKDSADIVSIIDLTASPAMREVHERVIFKTRHRIVTANKIPLVEEDYDTFQKLISEPSRYGYRCSVMAGAEAVDKIRDLRDEGDKPTEIIGSFSGTLGYIVTELEKGRKLSEIVSEAMKKGYTEPNPAVDLSGRDVASKILILARTAGARIDLKDIKLAPFVPEEYLRAADTDSFLKGLKELDAKFKAMMESASGNGATLRYMAKYVSGPKGPQITVKLEEVSLKDPYGQLKGKINRITIRTPNMGDDYYAVEAPGAGVTTTAQNIRRDLLHQLPERRLINGE